MERLLRPVTKISSSMPAAIASSAAYWIRGLSTIGSISLGLAFVTGKKRVPSPATGNTALVTRLIFLLPLLCLSSRRDVVQLEPNLKNTLAHSSYGGHRPPTRLR